MSHGNNLVSCFLFLDSLPGIKIAYLLKTSIMKNLILSTLIIAALSAGAQVTTTTVPENVNARKTEGGDVPNLIVEKFKGSVKNMEPSWTNTGNTYMAAYKDSSNFGHIITYDQNGNIITRQDEQGKTSYPASIERYHDKRFPDEKFTVWQSTDASNNKMYYFTRDKETVWFDPNGAVVERSANEKVKKP